MSPGARVVCAPSRYVVTVAPKVRKGIYGSHRPAEKYGRDISFITVQQMLRVVSDVGQCHRLLGVSSYWTDPFHPGVSRFPGRWKAMRVRPFRTKIRACGTRIGRRQPVLKRGLLPVGIEKGLTSSA